jgi:hypothetical protein
MKGAGFWGDCGAISDEEMGKKDWQALRGLIACTFIGRVMTLSKGDDK